MGAEMYKILVRIAYILLIVIGAPVSLTYYALYGFYAGLLDGIYDLRDAVRVALE